MQSVPMLDRRGRWLAGLSQWPGQDSNLRATDYEFCVPRDPR